jgi:hypothetical protein
MTTLDERRGFSSEIRRRINHTQQLDLPLHALAGLRRILERHGHVGRDSLCQSCKQEAPCPDLRDALDATCGPEGT